MMYEQNTVLTLYRKLLTLYPQAFKEQLGESMERTFQDLWNEKRRTRKERIGFVLWMFIETAIGIIREHMLLVSPGDMMQNILKTLGSSVLISFLIILPFMIMEFVNRRDFNEEFPLMLFFVLWLNLFTISLILQPIVRGWLKRNHDMVNPVLPQRNTLLTNPTSAAIISVILILFPFLLSGLNSLGWISLDRLFNGPDPAVVYLPGQIIALALFSIPIAAGLIAGGPIVKTLRAGGSLFAYPIHLILVLLILSPLAIGLVSLFMDQWPCFIGVPNCD
jgi:hypothetical protein